MQKAHGEQPVGSFAHLQKRGRVVSVYRYRYRYTLTDLDIVKATWLCVCNKG